MNSAHFPLVNFGLLARKFQFFDFFLPFLKVVTFKPLLLWPFLFCFIPFQFLRISETQITFLERCFSFLGSVFWSIFEKKNSDLKHLCSGIDFCTDFTHHSLFLLTLKVIQSFKQIFGNLFQFLTLFCWNFRKSPLFWQIMFQSHFLVGFMFLCFVFY